MQEMKYYKEDLDKLTKRVNDCSTDTLDSIEFFLLEADAHMQGISDNIKEKIRNEINRFKKDCKCKRSSIKKLEEIETAEEFIMTGYKR
jgi:hypothetical protein